MPIRGISPSLIEAYNVCPLQVYFDRILKPKPQVPEWIGKVFGDAIHHFIARHLYKQSQYPLGFKDKKSMIGFWCIYWDSIMKGDNKLFKRNVGQVWYRDGESPEDLKKRGIAILSLYWDSNINQPRPPFIEYEITTNFNGIQLVGVIDQIRTNPENERHIIIDLKTGRGYGVGERNEFPLDKNIQLTFYSMLYRMTFQKEEDSLAIYDLNEGKLRKTVRTEEDILHLQKVLTTISEDLTNLRFPRNFGKHCAMCDYQLPCYKPREYFSGENELTDEESEKIIFGYLGMPGVDISERKLTTIETNIKPRTQKPKQLRLKFKS
jgi:RecB family exonuclease